MTKEKKFKKYLLLKGLKYTGERKNLLKILNKLNGHFNADELMKFADDKNYHLSRATIYRNLPIFIKCGIIKKSVKKQGKINYENAFHSGHHDHLLCIKCGRVIEFKNDEIEKLQEKVCNEFDFKPVNHALNIKGICSDCHNKNNESIEFKINY